MFMHSHKQYRLREKILDFAEEKTDKTHQQNQYTTC